MSTADSIEAVKHFIRQYTAWPDTAVIASAPDTEDRVSLKLGDLRALVAAAMKEQPDAAD